jgi:spoIIIJ-associated protein
MVDIQKLVQEFFSLLTFHDADLNVEAKEDVVNITVTVPEESSGILIGYRGEKINALQLIFTLMVNNNAIAYRPVHVDINGYRERRHQSLREMADAAAGNAIDSGREILLPPLPSYERRIIHMHLQTDDRVETYSEGEGKDRRLVIRPVIAPEA